MDGHSRLVSVDTDPEQVPALIEDLEGRNGFVATKMAWASGVMVFVRKDG
jgi:hypothetical protein